MTTRPRIWAVVLAAGDGTRLAALTTDASGQMVLARQLFLGGALWSTFIFAARGSVLLEMLRARFPDAVAQMQAVIGCSGHPRDRSAALHNLYTRLPSVDFSRAIMHGAESELRVLTAPVCGWNDLGTPDRVAGALQHLQREWPSWATPSEHTRPYLAVSAAINLAAQHAQLGRAGQGIEVNR